VTVLKGERNAIFSAAFKAVKAVDDLDGLDHAEEVQDSD